MEKKQLGEGISVTCLEMHLAETSGGTNRFEPAVPLCLARAGRHQGNGSDILSELPGVGRFDTVPPQRACDPAAQLCQQLEADAGSVSRAVYFADVAKELTAGGPIVSVYLYIGCPGIF